MVPRPSTHAVAALTMVALSLPANPAAAQEIPCPDGPCVARARRGTHFLAEVSGGSVLRQGGGLSLEAVLGWGGKLRGFPPRFYLINETSVSMISAQGSTPLTGLHYQESTLYRDLSLGLRVYVPIHGPVRLFADVLGGASIVSGEILRDGLSPLVVSDVQGLAVAAGGVQVRLLHHLSVGFRARFVLTGDLMDDARELTQGSSPSRFSMTGGITWHF